MNRASLAEHRPPRARAGRRAICAWLGLSVLGAASKARTASYVDRAGLLIGEANRANDFLGKRLDDRELARLVARAAEGRLQAAKEEMSRGALRQLGWSLPVRP